MIISNIILWLWSIIAIVINSYFLLLNNYNATIWNKQQQ